MSRQPRTQPPNPRRERWPQGKPPRPGSPGENPWPEGKQPVREEGVPSAGAKAPRPAPVVVLYGVHRTMTAPEDADTLEQVQAVSQALLQLGYRVVTQPATLRLDHLRLELKALGPRLVFNLVESLGGTDALLPAAALLLESLGLPYTGVRAPALVLTNDKREAKRMLARAGLPTPAMVAEEAPANGKPPNAGDGPWIVKAALEHASLGMSDDAVVRDPKRLAVRLRERAATYGGPWFAEAFIEGREFNLSLLERGGRPVVLPPAEIRFGTLPAGKPRIVGYDAKWVPDSAAYRNTVRVDRFGDEDAPLLARLHELALDCWELFGLRGYARVDFRVDDRGRPWILEVNANPCLTPGAGFQLSAARAGLNYVRMIGGIAASAGSTVHAAGTTGQGNQRQAHPSAVPPPDLPEGGDDVRHPHHP